MTSLSSDSRAAFRQGFLDALPITASYVLFAAIFGMLSLQAGLVPWQSVAMSLIVYAGAAQFTALSMLADDASLWAIVLTTFLLNSRHLLMGFSLAPYYQHYTRTQVNGLAFLLTDESYAITLNRFQKHFNHPAYTFAVSISIYIAWAGGTWLGTAAGHLIPDPASLGLGFSFTAMFLALAYYQLSSLLRILTFIGLGVLAIWLSLLLPSGLPLLIVGIVAFAIGYFLPAEKAAKAEASSQMQEVESA